MIEPGRPPLEERADDHDAVLLRRGGQGLARRAGNRLGLGEPAMVLGLAEVGPGKQLLQADDIRPAPGCLGDSRERLLDVRLLGLRAGHLHEGDRDGAILDVVVGHARLQSFRFEVPSFKFTIAI